MSDFGGGALVDDDDDVLDHMLDAIVPPDNLCCLDDANNNNNNNTNNSSFVSDPIIPAVVFDSSFSTFHQIEEFLLNDDDDHIYSQDPNHHLAPADGLGFLSDILLDSPLPPDPSSSSPSVSTSDDNLSPEIDHLHYGHHAKDDQQHPNPTPQLLPPPPAIPQQQQEEEDNHLNNSSNNDDDDADPLAKKRKRQLRNRDAAVRSRERKKMYVKDLEVKSRYYEAECRRLGMLLQCHLAENHALRLSLHNNKSTQAFDASTTKQESAVLFLESLLLGSLLWFLGIVALLTLPIQLLSTPEAAGAEKVGRKNLGSLALREAGSNACRKLEFQSFMMTKRCRGSRGKIRCFAEVGLSISLPHFLSMTSY